MLSHNAKQTLKLGAAYIAIVWSIIMFVIVCSTPASAHPKFISDSKYKYVVVCEHNDITYTYYTNKVNDWDVNFVLTEPITINEITREETKLGEQLVVSNVNCMLLKK
ncbi:hypothetical protein SBP1_gp097 [Vibrio virus vB_VspP_SBP1]|uniref:Uncharacterized protein n=1 Tax=Vibrio virus vB_VspP_SBP1 TaxID=2500581 RepID=A0A3T0IIU7_9CAUD|nr:hypothetical protein KNU36_gp032 [Vibrio virus vB_VspP_SBP1]AZU99689.1 hypothetical protein SBP1_gp097 [Vibrio virus vB_VspP_SBP1]